MLDSLGQASPNITSDISAGILVDTERMTLLIYSKEPSKHRLPCLSGMFIRVFSPFIFKAFCYMLDFPS